MDPTQKGRSRHQLTPPRTASELGDSVSLGSTQTSNATQSSPDTILEEIDHDGTDLDSQYDPA
ncbi:MAG: hypothetical protein L6R37_002225 [Teloschistes peruensis]|nr:MAG: hypothetical protein L6R37_002225 [Teloschistes peruensis]